jgi:hypothetical protein
MNKIKFFDTYLDYPYIGALAIDRNDNNKSKENGKH